MKGAAYSQCREQIDGSWAPEPSWQCQQPGTSATGSSTASNPNTDGTSAGDGPSSVPANQNDGTLNTGSQAATIGDCTSASPPGGWEGVASTSVSVGNHISGG